MCRIAVLISGGGSNLQALLDDDLAGGEIALVISNRADAGGLARAAVRGIATQVIDHRQYTTRERFDDELAAALVAAHIELVVLAGFMRILTPAFVARFEGRMMNIHPSLLPRYPGLHTHDRVLAAGEREHGATVHFVTAELDGGPPIVQARIAVRAGDDATALAARVLDREHQIYPQAVRWFCSGRLCLVDGRAQLDGDLVPTTGVDWPPVA